MIRSIFSPQHQQSIEQSVQTNEEETINYIFSLFFIENSIPSNSVSELVFFRRAICCYVLSSLNQFRGSLDVWCNWTLFPKYFQYVYIDWQNENFTHWCIQLLFNWQMIDQMVSDSTLTNWYDKLNHHHVIKIPHTSRSEPSHVFRFLISNWKFQFSIFISDQFYMNENIGLPSTSTFDNTIWFNQIGQQMNKPFIMRIHDCDQFVQMNIFSEFNKWQPGNCEVEN